MLAAVDEIEQKKAALMVPVLAFTEILEVKNSAEAMDVFRRLLKRPNVFTVNITMQIAERAEAIRSRGLKEKPAKKVRTPDAIFVACASLYGANMLHTLDGPLLGLNGTNTAFGQTIGKPQSLSGVRPLC